MNNDDFDVVKKGDIHQPSYDKGYDDGEINAVKELVKTFREVLEEMEGYIKEKENLSP